MEIDETFSCLYFDDHICQKDDNFLINFCNYMHQKHSYTLMIPLSEFEKYMIESGKLSAYDYYCDEMEKTFPVEFYVFCESCDYVKDFRRHLFAFAKEIMEVNRSADFNNLQNEYGRVVMELRLAKMKEQAYLFGQKVLLNSNNFA